MNIIKERNIVEVKKVELDFYEKKTDEVRWGFPLTNGVVVPLDENDQPCKEEECTWWANYLNACKNEELYSEVRVYKWSYEEPAVGLCSCGNHVTLTDQFFGSCECSKCGQWYTLYGQACLNPEEQMKCQDW